LLAYADGEERGERAIDNDRENGRQRVAYVHCHLDEQNEHGHDYDDDIVGGYAGGRSGSAPGFL
jgi:hypothetical protein